LEEDIEPSNEECQRHKREREKAGDKGQSFACEMFAEKVGPQFISNKGDLLTIHKKKESGAHEGSSFRGKRGAKRGLTILGGWIPGE